MTNNIYKVTGTDESYTYPNLINPLLPFIDKFTENNGKDNITIWCPFDVAEDIVYRNADGDDIQLRQSNYIKIFKLAGYNVVHSHIVNGQDFFEYEPDDYDIIISNPPFKNKAKFFERALELNKPFALVAPIIWLNDSTPNKLFDFDEFSLIIPQRRAEFFNPNLTKKTGSISFKSAYFCRNFTEKQINFINIDKE